VQPDAGAVELIEVEANGFLFSVRVSGPAGGRPVVLLHGFPESSTSWLPVMRELAAAGYRSVSPDQRGYSPAARPVDVGAYRVPALVDDVLAVASAMELGPFDVVGHDWGGIVAWHLAADHTDVVRSLTAVSTPHPAALFAVLASGDAEQARRLDYITTFRRFGEAEALLLGEDGSGDGLRRVLGATGLPDEYAEEYVEFMRRPGVLTAALNWYRAMEPAAAGVARVPPVVVPTLYVWSTGDVAFGRAAAERTAEYVAGRYAFEVLEGVSHWIPEEAPGELARLVLAHLAPAGW
jgi:pimeloyl-ACP methyl ester carboxylesterase